MRLGRAKLHLKMIRVLECLLHSILAAILKVSANIGKLAAKQMMGVKFDLAAAT